MNHDQLKWNFLFTRGTIMSFRDKDIQIEDWAGNQLFIGPYDSKDVDIVLDANRCKCDADEECKTCNGSGYTGDFEIFWIDESDKDGCNVYEYIDY
jgi:hypothetical protein